MWPFGKKENRSVALVDIRSSSVSAAFVVLRKGSVPEILHSVHVQIDAHATEPVSEAMLRTLRATLSKLTLEGSPLVLKTLGSGSVDKILVTMTSPWQSSHIRSVKKIEPKAFVFTKKLLEELTQSAFTKKEGRVTVSELVISTFLNGYETSNPFGKSIKELEVLSLSTDIEESIYTCVTGILKEVFHTRSVDVYAYLPEVYAVLRDAYPHQKDYLVLDVGSTNIDVLVVKHGLLIDLPQAEHGVGDILKALHTSGVSHVDVPLAGGVTLSSSRNTSFEISTQEAKNSWIESVKTLLEDVASREPLPRLVFLHSEQNVSEFITRLLDAPELRSLWLTQDALTLFQMQGSQFSKYVSVPKNITLSPPLYILALAAHKRYTNV